MLKPFAACLMFGLALTAAAPADAEGGPFACVRRETMAYLPELQTSSGYRWIECLVLGPAVANVESVAVNNGKCKSFDYWYAGRSFAPGQAIVIPYACMTPVSVTISANGFWWPVRLR
ncbi:hypothetical protein AMST5_02180 [freshwater sediment metagenome]|jgi:hypothetical protein|uniref:Uncharacterized protein n=1 Tax=freshwater sediment metagenome TaxID=556182 RepID=A0AA48LZK5_9ZZZZ